METNGPMESAIQERIEFAWHNFEDQQAIIRAADLKAGYLVPFLLFFGASTIPLGTEVIPKLRFGNAEVAIASGLYLLTSLALTVGFVWSLAQISRAMTPRIARHHQSPHEGASLLYYEHVLRHKDNAAYYEAVSKAGLPQAESAKRGPPPGSRCLRRLAMSSRLNVSAARPWM